MWLLKALIEIILTFEEANQKHIISEGSIKYCISISVIIKRKFRIKNKTNKKANK